MIWKITRQRKYRGREGKKIIIGAKLEIFYVHTPLGDGWNTKTNRTSPWNDYFSHKNQSHALSNVGETADMCTRWVMDETPKQIERHPETTILATEINRTHCPTLAKRLTCDRHASTYLFLKKFRGWFEKLQGNANTEEERGGKRIISDKLKIFYVHTPLGDGWNTKTNRTPSWNDYFSHRNQSHAPSNVGETTNMWSTHVNISF